MRTNPFFELYAKEPREDFPWVIDVEATNVCNLKCQMCSRQIMKREIGFMDWDTFTKIIAECSAMGAGIRFIRWGEPFLNPNLMKFVKYAKDNGVPVHITNNGQIVSINQLQELVNLELDSIIFSMQGATKERYEKMRVGANYDRLRTTVLALNSMRGNKDKPFVQITSTMTDETDEEIKAFKEYWENHADRVTVGKTHFTRLTKERPNYVPCREVYTKLSVDWNGDITACCGDYDKMLTIGNIHKATLFEAFNSHKMRAIRTLLDNGCHRCLTLCSTCSHAYGDV